MGRVHGQSCADSPVAVSYTHLDVYKRQVYDRNPRAMKLRAMNLAYEGAKDSKGVLLAPSALADGFNVGQVGGGE